MEKGVLFDYILYSVLQYSESTLCMISVMSLKKLFTM